MRKFIKNILKVLIIFLPLFIFSLYCKYFILRFCDGEIPYYIWNKRRENKNFEVCILGDSTANAAYVPNVLGTNTINISLGGCSSIEMYYVFSNYLKKNAVPKVCYISFSDTHLNKQDCL